jgi:hypothetical protein
LDGVTTFTGGKPKVFSKRSIAWCCGGIISGASTFGFCPWITTGDGSTLGGSVEQAASKIPVRLSGISPTLELLDNLCICDLGNIAGGNLGFQGVRGGLLGCCLLVSDLDLKRRVFAAYARQSGLVEFMAGPDAGAEYGQHGDDVRRESQK